MSIIFLRLPTLKSLARGHTAACKLKLQLLVILMTTLPALADASTASSLQRGARPQRNQRRGQVVRAARHDGKTLSLVSAAGKGKTAEVIALLRRGADVNARAPRGAEGIEGQTPLMAAAAHGHDATIRALLERGAAVNLRHEAGGTALTAAAAGGHLEAVKVLLAAGADPNVVLAGAHGAVHSALMFAMKPENKNWIGVMDAMIAAGAEANPRAGFALSPLRWAIEKGDATMLKASLDRGADVNVRDSDGSTPLIFAARHSTPGIVKALLDAGANVNAKNNDGETALSIATKNRDESLWAAEIISILKQAGAAQ